ncbi:MAG: hypothetical protein F4X17_00820 [Gemmatimonadetes bacterium]|nr:hypothetical protein [Gemmatimonadota bacterium]
MKKITVSVDEETYRLARIRAAELDTSVSALVRDYLRSLASDSRDAEKEVERRRELMRQVFEDFEASGIGLRMSDNLTREELYDRARARAEAQAAVAENQDLKRG